MSRATILIRGVGSWYEYAAGQLHGYHLLLVKLEELPSRAPIDLVVTALGSTTEARARTAQICDAMSKMGVPIVFFVRDAEVDDSLLGELRAVAAATIEESERGELRQIVDELLLREEAERLPPVH